MMVDGDIESFLVFPPMTDLHDNALLKAGHIILQDKVRIYAVLHEVY
jgi:hypothetical protein